MKKEASAVYDGTKLKLGQWQGCVPSQGCGKKKFREFLNKKKDQNNYTTKNEKVK